MMTALPSDERLYEAMASVGDELGPNIAVVVPPERKDVDPLSVLIALGGLLLVAYLKGVQGELEGNAEAAGKATVRWLRDKVRKLFEQEPDQASEESRNELRRVVHDVSAVAGETEPAIESASARELVEDYLRSSGMSPKAAARAAATVQVKAFTLVVPVAQ